MAVGLSSFFSEPVITIIEEHCLHTIVMKDMCCECGADLRMQVFCLKLIILFDTLFTFSMLFKAFVLARPSKNIILIQHYVQICPMGSADDYIAELLRIMKRFVLALSFECQC